MVIHQMVPGTKGLSPFVPGTKGFSLVEVIVAMTILAIVVPIISSAFVSSNRWTDPNKNIAMNLARAQAEQLHEAVRQDFWAQSGQPLSVGGPYNNTVINPQNSFTKFTREYTVTTPAAQTVGPQKDYRKVEVTVDW